MAPSKPMPVGLQPPTSKSSLKRACQRAEITAPWIPHFSIHFCVYFICLFIYILHVNIHICIYIYIYIYTYIYIHIHIHIHTIYLYTYIYIYTHLSVCVCACVCVCVLSSVSQLRLYVCVCRYIYIYACVCVCVCDRTKCHIIVFFPVAHFWMNTSVRCAMLQYNFDMSLLDRIDGGSCGTAIVCHKHWHTCKYGKRSKADWRMDQNRR